jgi:hypothetical protein
MPKPQFFRQSKQISVAKREAKLGKIARPRCQKNTYRMVLHFAPDLVRPNLGGFKPGPKLYGHLLRSRVLVSL